MRIQYYSTGSAIPCTYEKKNLLLLLFILTSRLQWFFFTANVPCSSVALIGVKGVGLIAGVVAVVVSVAMWVDRGVGAGVGVLDDGRVAAAMEGIVALVVVVACVDKGVGVGLDVVVDEGRVAESHKKKGTLLWSIVCGVGRTAAWRWLIWSPHSSLAMAALDSASRS